ncbi:CRISPR/Cas system type I-B associated protein Csh2 (Cas7 group RAMP superfamily) [Bradyrhizobium sp. i1.8.4]
MVGAAGQRLSPFQVDASRRIGVEIKPTNVQQDLLVSVASREFAKAAGFVVDAEFKAVTRARLDEIVDEILWKLFLMAFRSLLAQQGPIL